MDTHAQKYCDYDFATDNGPKCARCGSTSWTYSFFSFIYGSYGNGKRSHAGTATCCGCRMVEGPLRRRKGGNILPLPMEPSEARRMHEDFHAEVLP